MPRLEVFPQDRARIPARVVDVARGFVADDPALLEHVKDAYVRHCLRMQYSLDADDGVSVKLMRDVAECARMMWL